MRDEQELREHWDQMCLRHHEGLFEEIGVDFSAVQGDPSWHDVPEDLRRQLRPLVERRLEQCERLEHQGYITRIRELRERQGLSLADAKRVLLREHGINPEHHLDDLAEELKEIEEE